MGLTRGSLEAYCLDEAVFYFGTTVSNELEAAGQKRGKGQGKVEAARQRVFMKFMGDEGKKQQKFADPAAFFQTE